MSDSLTDAPALPTTPAPRSRARMLELVFPKEEEEYGARPTLGTVTW